MREEIVTPVVPTIDLPAPQPILEKVTAALKKEGIKRCSYSPEMVHLLQHAWRIAAHGDYTQVRLEHLVLALIWYSENGPDLATSLRTDVDTLATNCAFGPANLGLNRKGAIDVKLSSLEPAVAAARWLRAAAEVAKEQGGSGDLVAQDLIQAVVQKKVSSDVASSLRSVAAESRTKRYTGLVAEPGTSAAVNRRFADPVEFIADVLKGQSQIDAAIRDALDKFEVRQLNAIQEIIDQRAQNLEQRFFSLTPVIERLDAIDRNVLAIRDAQPRPPSGLRLAVAIVAVIMLGVATGLALTQTWKPSASGGPQATASATR